MEQWIGSKLGKEYIKAVYCHPAYLTYMQSISCEMQGWMSISWDQDCWEKYQSQISDDTTLVAESKEKLKSLLMKVKDETEKSLELNIQKMKITASSPIISWQMNEEKMETVTDFIFLGCKITEDG